MLRTIKRIVIGLGLALVTHASLARPIAAQPATPCGGCMGMGYPLAVEACTETGYICSARLCTPPCGCCACSH